MTWYLVCPEGECAHLCNVEVKSGRINKWNGVYYEDEWASHLQAGADADLIGAILAAQEIDADGPWANDLPPWVEIWLIEDWIDDEILEGRTPEQVAEYIDENDAWPMVGIAEIEPAEVDLSNPASWRYTDDG